MTRESAFKSFAAHPWLGRVYKQLSRAEVDIALGFMADNSHLANAAFERAAVRMFLDRPKPKHWTAIEELLICANSAIK